MVVRVGWVCVWLQLGPLGGVEVYEDAAQQDIVQGVPYVGTYYLSIVRIAAGIRTCIQGVVENSKYDRTLLITC